MLQGDGDAHTSLMGNVRRYDYHRKVRQFLKKLNVELQYDPITSHPNPSPNAKPGKQKTNIHTETCTRNFRATLFIVAEKWRQPDVPPMING